MKLHQLFGRSMPKNVHLPKINKIEMKRGEKNRTVLSECLDGGQAKNRREKNWMGKMERIK